jgi:hypothetical protein
MTWYNQVFGLEPYEEVGATAQLRFDWFEPVERPMPRFCSIKMNCSYPRSCSLVSFANTSCVRRGRLATRCSLLDSFSFWHGIFPHSKCKKSKEIPLFSKTRKEVQHRRWPSLFPAQLSYTRLSPHPGLSHRTPTITRSRVQGALIGHFIPQACPFYHPRVTQGTTLMVPNRKRVGSSHYSPVSRKISNTQSSGPAFL